jgi:hypothetical protein
MEIGQDARETGRKIASVSIESLSTALRDGVEKFIGHPFKVSSGSVIDSDNKVSDLFAAIVYVETEESQSKAPSQLPADSTAVVIDATDNLTIDKFRAAYLRVAKAKRLKKSPTPLIETPTTNVTLGLIYAQASDLTLEAFAKELERLNSTTPSCEWPDMIVVSSIGAIQYAVQFPGESLSGDYLPPAEGALSNYIPAIYVVMVLRPTVAFTFNKMMSFVVAHLGIFSPGAKLSNYTLFLENVPKTAVVFSGYQYDLKGNLNSVPSTMYQDRMVPVTPQQITDQRGNHLASIQLVPWQDGNVILLRGKLPLLGLLPFFGQQDLLKSGVVNRPDDLQVSYVLPITSIDFDKMLTEFQQRSNMLVKRPQSQWIVQKLADEGSASPFMARLFMGLMRLRDTVCSDLATRESFDAAFDFVPSTLLSTRMTVREILGLWEGHARKVASGEVILRQGTAIHINENIDKELRKQVEHFLNSASRVVKQGMQGLTKHLGTDIGFLFKQQSAFESGVDALRAIDPLLADYLQKSRQIWSERLIESRNNLEHKNWSLPRVTYNTNEINVVAIEPQIAGQAVTEFVQEMLDRICCFVEDVSAHCLQKKMPMPITIAEIILGERRPEAPERFQVTLSVGGQPRWEICYPLLPFDKI